MDIPPKNIFNEKDIFGNVEGATSYLARLYGVLPMEDFRYSFEHGFGYSGAMYRQMCCATGEAVGRDTQGFFYIPFKIGYYIQNSFTTINIKVKYLLR